jgi:hypothetical protein
MARDARASPFARERGEASFCRGVGAAYGVVWPLMTRLRAGANEDGRYVLTLLNPSNGQEQVLGSPGDEIEIYHLSYAADENTMMFEGLRFSDNRYVIGQVNLSTLQVSATPTGTGQLVDFSTF